MTLLWMIFLHILDDYVLQMPILSKLKQRTWWQNQNGYTDKYKRDYIVGLFMHAFSWSFMVHLPFIYYGLSEVYLIPSIILHCIIHGCIDDIKANRFKINLVQDQILHLLQIAVIYVMLLI